MWKMLDVAVDLIFIISVCQAYPNPAHKVGSAPISKRNVNLEAEATQIGCIHMTSEPGEYWYSSPGGSQVCGLYMIAPADKMIEIRFQAFQVDCDKGSIVEFFDGWEASGQYIPNEEDHDIPLNERYQDFCGKRRPRKSIISSQNVALLQYRITSRSQGFRVRLYHRKHPTPCNVVAPDSTGVLTLSNHGRDVNCTATIIHPEMVTIETVNVGTTPELPKTTVDSGIMHKCVKRGFSDHVAVLRGNGLDPNYMIKEADFCGSDTNAEILPYLLTCRNSAVRLVSSGRYHNSVTFRYRQITSEELVVLPQKPCF